jgi:branched-chain amino acid transport system permease protein
MHHLLVFNIVDQVRTLGWPGFWTLLRNGIVSGSLLALIALGYTMVYGILKLLNFAHGDIYMVGAFIGYGVLVAFGGALSPTIPIVPLIILMFAVAMAGSGFLGVAIERVAYRPLRNAPRIAPLISALGVLFFLESSVQLLTNSAHVLYEGVYLGGKNLNGVPSFGPLLNAVFTVDGIPMTVVDTLVVLSAAALMVVLVWLVYRTKFGKAMRAVAFDREAAAMMGIDVDRVISMTFFIGSVLAGAAGVMYGLYIGDTYFFLGFQYGLLAFTAAVVGGIGSIPGAMLGGVLIGLFQSFSTGYVGGQWSEIVVFGILIGFLIVRPNGLLGSRAIQKV